MKEKDNETSKTANMLTNLLDQKNDKGEAILNLTERYINHFAVRYLNLSKHEQQDIKQEVAISFLSHGDKMRESCSRSWIYTVVRNCCINHVRKQISLQDTLEKKLVTKTKTLMQLQSESIWNKRSCEEIDFIENIFRIQDEKPTSQKDDPMILELYLHGYSYGEIAERIKRSESTIANRISTLKRQLKDTIGEINSSGVLN